MTDNEWNIILGPPGTGKTTTLLDIVEDRINQHVDPRNVCFVAFTRKAANEAKYRAQQRFNLLDEDLPYFRTLHSLAYRELGIQRGQVLGVSDLFKIARMLGLYLTAKGVQEDGTVIGLSKGDRLFFMEAMARARMMSIEEYWGMFPDEDIDLYELDQLHRTIKEYKEVNGKIDFSDMLELYLQSPRTPPIETLIVDEAQDLSPIQWRIVYKLAENANEVFIAGDDDQAIFSWAGADVNQFIRLPGSKQVLSQSWRCPAAVHQVANQITASMQTRIPKEYHPATHPGLVDYALDLSHIDMSKGTWLLLARNVYLLQDYVDHCMENGYVFDSIIASPVKGDELRAIVAWENLRKGKLVSFRDIRYVYEYMSANKGYKKGCKKRLSEMPEEHLANLYDLQEHHGLLVNDIWHKSLDRISMEFANYFLSALKQGEKLLKEPRIKINTIHGVKGGEADNVVLMTDMATRTYNEYMDNPDPEHRVWYVGVTRARKNLYIVQPKTDTCYEGLV